MKNKLIWAIVCWVLGFVVFLMGGNLQYVGALIIAVGIFLADIHNNERKEKKTKE